MTFLASIVARRPLLRLVSWGLLAAACSTPEGSEGGACFGNGTCNAGLVCLSDLCVAGEAELGTGFAGAAGAGSGHDLGGGRSSADGGSSGGSTTEGQSGGDSSGGSSSGGRQSSGGGQASGGRQSSGGDSSGGSSSGGRQSSGGSSSGGDSSTGGGAQGSSGGTGGGAQGSSGGTGGVPDGVNLIENNTFAAEAEDWVASPGALSIQINASGSLYCIHNPNTQPVPVSVQYPDNFSKFFPVQAGKSYHLSYRVVGFAAGEIRVAGMTFDDFSVSDGSQLNDFSFEFTAASSVAQTALIFDFEIPGTDDYEYGLCFDEVNLIERD